MIVPDANLLIYAYNEGSEWHRTARQWLEKSFSDNTQIAFPWLVILAFLRLTTNPRVFPKPFSIQTVTAIVQSWLAQPNVALLLPGENHWSLLRKLLEDHQLNRELVSDAHLAALCMEHGAMLYTTDRDFARFKGLALRNPLAR